MYSELCMALHLKDTDVPRSWKQAAEIPCWSEAMEREISELKELGAWELVPRPPGVNVLPGLWHFKVKRDENGNVARYNEMVCGRVVR